MIYIIIILGGCKSYEVNSTSLENKIKVEEEKNFNIERLTYHSDNINSALVNRKITYNDLFDRVFDISKAGDKYIYQSIEGQTSTIYYKTNNGKTKKRLIENKNVWDCCFANNGEDFAYVYALGGFVNIYGGNVNDKYSTKRITEVRTWTVNPMFSPDDSRIIYAKRDRTGGKYNTNEELEYPEYKYFIYEYDMKTKDHIAYWMGYNPCYFPNDQHKIAFVKINDKLPELWIGDLRTNEEKLLLSDPEIGFVQPSVSPDGRKIVFTSVSRDNESCENYDLYIVDSDGKNKKRLTYHSANDYSPRWASDGNSIYFVSDRGNQDKNHNIWKLSLITYNKF